MADVPFVNLELTWALMSPMESSVWGINLALHGRDPDGGLAAADAAVIQLRLIGGVRSRLPEPEYEAARANAYIEYEEFAVWYPIQFRIRHGFDRGYAPPSPEQTKEAYERFNFSRCDFY